MLQTSYSESIQTLAHNKRARVIAHYLPQFHPIPENDMWWGKGFTEWTNVAKAKPLFRGHCQPNVPADLGFYDLRVPETRLAQAEMARQHGVEAFCYWHYWFAGQRLLERPFDEVLRSGEPDFPFCLGWANHTWSGVWYGAPNTVLKEQTYPGLHEHEAHFNWLLKAFNDPRYLTVDGKPFFLLFYPAGLPDARRVTDFWRGLATKAGLKGLHLVGITHDTDWNPSEHGFDAVTISRMLTSFTTKRINWLSRVRRKLNSHRSTQFLADRLNTTPFQVRPYEEIYPLWVVQEPLDYEYYPCVIPNWDNTPRSGARGSIMTGSTPELFRKHLQVALDRVADVPDEHRIIMLKSWNEWAEGNYMEPDLKWGSAYLEVLREEILAVDRTNSPQASKLGHLS